MEILLFSALSCKNSDREASLQLYNSHKNNFIAQETMKIFALFSIVLYSLTGLSHGFFFGARSCQDCATFIGCFFTCGRALGPAVGFGKRRRRFAKETHLTNELDQEELLLDLSKFDES